MIKRILRQIALISLVLIMAMETWASAVAIPSYDVDTIFANRIASNWITRYVNGKPIPIAGYGQNTYYTQNGMACTDHNPPPPNKPVGTNCISNEYGKPYGGSGSQCVAFAWEVYVNLFGSDTYGFHVGDNTAWTSWNASSARVFFENTVTPGAHIRVRTKGGGKHSFVFVEADSTGITLYDANAVNTCAVRMSKYTYSELVTSYPGRYWYQEAHKFNANTAVNAGASGHYVNCSYPGCVEHSPKLSQHYIIGTPGYGTCVACGYTGYISIGTTSLPDTPVTE